MHREGNGILEEDDAKICAELQEKTKWIMDGYRIKQENIVKANQNELFLKISQ